MIGKAEIELGKAIIKENLQAEIDASPIDQERSKAMLTLMMEGGWDQRASGKAIIVHPDESCPSDQERTKYVH